MPASSPTPQGATLLQIGREHDGARILWRFFLATDDRSAFEGHVREFSPAGDYVRIAKTNFKDDKGAWLRCWDVRLVAVLETHLAVVARPRVRREQVDDEAGE